MTPWQEFWSLSWPERLLLVAGATVVAFGGWIIVALAFISEP